MRPHLTPCFGLPFANWYNKSRPLPPRSAIFVIGISAFLLESCTSLSPLRPGAKSIATENGYKVAFVEFGEQGSYQDPQQLANALSLIRETSNPLILTYVHGWQNNAKSGDVGNFESLLTKLDNSPAIRSAGYHVVGIYLSWRGKMTDIPVLKELSFWNRKATAERLASNYDVYDAIASISEEARKGHPDKQYTILMGHSFGGLIVERSVAHAINAEIHGRSDPSRSMPADLMIAINPAADSILARQMIEALYVRHTEDTRPLFVSITSRGDGATGTFFPIGTRLASISKRFNEVKAPGPPGPPESEEKYYTSTPGHNELLTNYNTVDLHKLIASPNGLPALEENLEHNHVAKGFVLDGANGKLDLWQIQRAGGVDVPYWDVKVDPSIIKDHGDIWNDKAEAMMAAIFRMANPKINSAAKPRAILNRSADTGRVRSLKENR